MKVLITPRSFAKNDKRPVDILRQYGVEIVFNPGEGIMTEEQMKESIVDCDGVIIGVDPLNKAILREARQLKAVAKYGVGVDNIDVHHCREKEIKISRTVGANSAAVADYAFALMMSLARKIVIIDRECRDGNWKKITTSDVAGKKLGLLGLGAIGREMVKRARGFSMEILAYDVFWDDDYAKKNNIKKAEIDEICEQCDFISLHLPLSEETMNIIDERRLKLMKSSTYLINTARGGLIDDEALLKTLEDQKIAGAGIDAFAKEPPDNETWFKMENVILGSHCAASTIGAADNMSHNAADNILRDLGLKKEKKAYV